MKALKVLGVIALLAISRSASAVPLNLNLNPEPDIYSSFISIVYDAGSDAFMADGFAEILTTGGAAYSITGMSRLFDLDATIDSDGELVGVGSLVILGEVLGHGTTLLTGNIHAFGFNDMAGEEPDPFEFWVNTTGGDLEFMFPDGFGVILTVGSELIGPPNGENPQGGTVFGGDFESDAWMGVANAAPIPEPSASLLALVGGMIVAQQLRRDARRQ